LFSLSISDNGTGFDTDGVNDAKGLGLINMKNRAQLLNGNLIISSGKEIGTTIILNIPLS